MFAFHIVIENFELGLSVDVRLVREQQVAAALCRVGTNRPDVHHDLAAEHRMRRSIGDAFVQLHAFASGCGMVDQGMRIGDLATCDQCQPVKMHFHTFTSLRDMQGMT